jgi:endonuclease/exonuclease/phosphatase (EEP) superfamily protein YafD
LLLGLGTNANFVLPYYLPRPVMATQSQPLRILHMNLYGPNRNLQAVVAEIERTRPDLISFQEYGDSFWKPSLMRHSALKDYIYRISTPGYDDGVYSKIPLNHIRRESVPIQTMYSEGHPPNIMTKADTSILAQLTLGKTAVSMLFSHPPTPITPERYARLGSHLAYWQKQRPQYGSPFILVGDLNLSPWGYPLQQFLSETNLTDSQLGFGIQGSYMLATKRLRPFLYNECRCIPVPIDHILVSPEWVVLNRELGKDVGSDHYPVLIDIALKR